MHHQAQRNHALESLLWIWLRLAYPTTPMFFAQRTDCNIHPELTWQIKGSHPNRLHAAMGLVAPLLLSSMALAHKPSCRDLDRDLH